MSKTIDQRVVEMQFDNKNFEKNVAQSMSTLDKLKEKLSFKGASKAMDELNGSMKKFDAGFIGDSLDKVGIKFDGWFVAKKRVIENFVDGIQQKIEATIKSMSGLENMSAGWEKYGNKTTSVATLVAQGYDIEKVEEQLEKLNFFTDETSYNFVDMVGNIGKFTAAGQGLEESLTAMQGIATWAALSGQNAATASRAMYQLSQAMGSGMMRKEDYKSIQNASMDTQEFRQKALDAAVAIGTLTKTTDEFGQVYYKSTVKNLKDGLFTIDQFADHLTEDQWFNSDVMMMVYKDYGKASNTLIQYMDKYSDELGTASEAMDDIEEKAQKLVDAGKAADLNEALQKVSLQELADIPELYSEATAFIKEYNSTLAAGETPIENIEDALVEMGYGLDEFSLKAFRAAQEARTWSDVLDSVKDAVSTGWMNTFQAIFGNQQEATKLWTRFANDFWDIFASGGEDRNGMLDLWNEWLDPKDRDKALKIASSEAAKIFKENNAISGRDVLFSTDKEDLGAVISLLETLKSLLSTIKDAWNEIFYGTTDADEIAQQKADTLMSITMAIKAFADSIRINEEAAGKLRRTFKGLFAILDIVKNFISSAFKSAWTAISSLFGSTNVDVLEMTASFGDSLVALRDWLKENDVFGKVFEGIGQGIATVISWIKSFIGYVRSLPWVENVINGIQTGFSSLIDYISEFFTRIGSGEKASDVIKNIADRLSGASDAAKFFIDAFTNVKDFFSNIFESISGGKDFGTIISEIVDSVQNGFGSIGETLGNVGTAISDFWTGTATNLENAKTGIGSFVDKIKELLGQINGERVVQLLAGSVIFVFIFKMISAIKTFLDFFGTVGEAFETIANAVKNLGRAIGKSFKTVSKAMAENLRAKAMVSLATSILMIVGALTALYFMASDPEKLRNAVIALGAIFVGLTVLSKVASKSNGLYKVAAAVGALGAALLVLVGSINLLSSISSSASGWNSIAMVAVIGGIVTGILALVVLLTKNMSKLGNATGTVARLKYIAILLVSFIGSILMLSLAAKLLSTVDDSGFAKAIASIGVLIGSISALIVLTSVFKNANFKGLGLMLMGIATSLLLFAAGIVAFSFIPDDVFEKGATKVALIGAICAALIAVSFLSGDAASKAGSMILKMSVAFVIMAGVVKLFSFIDDSELARGLGIILAFSAICAALIVVSRFAGQAAAKAGLMLIELSGAMVILTGVIWALAYLPTDALVKASAVVAGLMVVFGALIFISKIASDDKDITKNLIVLTVAIVALAGSVFALSMLDPNNVVAAAAAMSMVLVAFGAVIAATKLAQKAMSTLIILTVAIGLIGGMLYLLGQSDKDSGAALKNAAGIAILLSTMAGVLLILSKINVTGKLGQLFALVGAIALLSLITSIIADVIYDMKDVDPSSVIPQVTALTILLVAMTGVVAALGVLGSLIGKGGISSSIGGGAGLAGGLLALLALSGILLILNDVILEMKEIDASAAISYAGAISSLLLTMAGVIAIICAIGVVGSLTGGIGAVAGLVAGMIALVALAGVLTLINDVIIEMKGMDAGSAVSYAEALTNLLTTMSNTLVALAQVGLLAVPAILGVAVLALAVEGMIFLSQQIGALMSQNDNLKKFMDEGLPIIEQLGTSIGTFFGNIIGGFIKGVGNNVLELLPTFGSKLSEFSTNVQPFINMLGEIKPEELQNANSLAAALIALTAAEFISGIMSFASLITGGDGFTYFATGLKSLGKGVADFSNEVNGNIYEDDIDAAISALTKLVDINNSINVITAIASAVSLSLFATQMKNIGTGIANFSTAVNGKIYPQQNEYAFTALSKLVAINDSINVITAIASAVSLSLFATQMKNIGTGIADFSTAVNGKIYPQQNEYALTALSKLVAINDKVSVLETIAGAVGLSAFASQMGYIADGIADFSTTVNGKITPQYNEWAISALSKLVNIGKDMDIISSISQTAGLNTFASQMKYIGQGIVDFSATVKDNIDKEADDNALDAIERLSSIQKSHDIIGWIAAAAGMDLFASNMPLIASGIAGFSKNVNGNIYPQQNEYAFTALSKLSGLAKSIGGDGFGFIDLIANLTSLDLFASNMPFIGKGIGGFVSSIGGALSSTVVNTSVNNALGIITSLSDVANDVGGDIGPWSFIEKVVGYKELELFSKNLPLIGSAISGFAQKLMSSTGTENVDTSIDILKKLGELSELIDKVIDPTKMESVVTDLNSYREAISNLGTALSDICSDKSKFSADDIQNISDRIDELAIISEKAKNLDTSSIASALSYSSMQNPYGGADINGYISDAASNGAETFDSAFTSQFSYENIANTFTSGDMFGGMPDLFNADGEVGKLLNSAGSNGGDQLFNGLFGGFDASSMVSTFTSGDMFGGMPDLFSAEGEVGKLLNGAGSNGLDSLLGGLSGEEAKGDATEAGAEVGDTFISGFKSKYADIKNVGTFAVTGLINAIKEMAPKVTTAGEEIAEALTDGLKLTLQIQSPSRIMYGLGSYAGEGFVNALTDYVSISNQVGGDVGQSATDGIRAALDKSASMFDTTVDIEPTIRPVLDLSNVTDGIGQLDNMFDETRSMQLAGSTSLAMNARDMNVENEVKVDNSDIIKELSNLRADMGTIADKLSQFEVRMDTGALVGQLVAPMDTALGTKAVRSKRG